MKKLLIILIALSLIPLGFSDAEAKKRRKRKKSDDYSEMDSSSSGASYGDQDKSDGCGLGWQVTDKKTLIATTTRGSTNSFVPNTFGMTTGTLGCDQHGFAKKEKDAAIFAANNYDSLKLEMAEGRGEYLEGFARTFGCSDQSMDTFSTMTQDNYLSIIGDGQSSGIQMFKNVKSHIKKNPELAANCSAV